MPDANQEKKKMDSRKNGKRCVLEHCRKTPRNSSGLRIFRFPPEDSILGKIWREACGLKREKKNLYICENHFSREFIGLRKLTKEAIPSLFLLAPPDSEIPEREREDLTLLHDPKRKRINSEAHDEVFCSNCAKTIKNTHFYVKQTTSNSSVSIIEQEKRPETTINVLPPTHLNEKIPLTKGEEDRPQKKINVLPIEHPKDLHTKQSFFAENVKNEKPKFTIIVLPTLNLRDPHEGENFVTGKRTSTEIARTKQETPLSRMRLLIQNKAKDDKFALFGEQIAHKLRRSKKHVSEINFAKQHIDNVLQNLHNFGSQIV